MKRIANSKKLVGKTYSLRPFTLDNITDEYIGWLNDPSVNKFLEIRIVNQTIETVTKYINSFYPDDFDQENEKYLWGIYSIDNRLVGTVNLTKINRYHNSTELGLMIGNKDFWGRSASEEAIKLVHNFAFNTLKLNRVTGHCYSTNMGMIFTFKRSGYKREGVMRKSHFDGEKQIDFWSWAILLEEWKNG